MFPNVMSIVKYGVEVKNVHMHFIYSLDVNKIDPSAKIYMFPMAR